MRVYDPQIHGTPKQLLDSKSDQVLTEALGFYSREGLSFVGSKNKDKRKKLTGKVRAKLDDIKENAEDGLKKVGKIVAKGAVAVPRAAYLALLRLNYRASATKLFYANPEGKAKFIKFWEKIGGEQDSLFKAIEAGRDKKPLACGKKCKLKASKNSTKDPKTALETAQFVNVMGWDDVLELLGAASTVLGAANKIVDSTKPTKEGEKPVKEAETDLKKEDAKQDAEDKSMTPEEKKEADALIKQQEQENNPVVQIENNPNITPEEKKAAVEDLKKTLKSTGESDSIFKKPTFYIIAGLVLIGVVILYKKRSQPNI
jgi:hypothetical protein